MKNSWNRMEERDWFLAKEQLRQEGYTCVLQKGDMQYISKERGVKPLMDWIREGVELQGFSAADKVVGKATAFLYVLAGVKQVFALVMSEPAVQVFSQYGITFEAEQIVPAIRNRDHTGFCPMEQAVTTCQTPEEAFQAIRLKQQELQLKRCNYSEPISKTYGFSRCGVSAK